MCLMYNRPRTAARCGERGGAVSLRLQNTHTLKRDDGIVGFVIEHRLNTS